MGNDLEYALVENKSQCRECFAVMQELRPHLTDADSFVEQVFRQGEQGFRLLALREHGQVIGLAGFRVAENTLYGRFVYVDDLVVTASQQRRELGAGLLEEVRRHTRALGYRYLVLDTGMHMPLAQRFYFRQGLLAKGMHFSQDLSTGRAV
ncbi:MULTISPECIES: GNAT family N-acetyltransferase [unclassified Pseudomonas]|uniref:GNAT family N-acetyltransferase n=1 Tax=unclassified Pseudomonas TaxID=196821 RepID=UPI00128D30B6|nr:MULTISPECIES: GNAT family N-acetyltransferase [unclassified Pseudomonas]MPQ67100.1 GNAT family N-acetyltransferase [Pseudomonas sp. MWU12-2323]